MSDRSEESEVTVNQHELIGLGEVCAIVNLRTEVVCRWVEEGVVSPRGERVSDWQFSQGQIQRIRQARRLQHDLELNTASLPLVLDLLQEVRQLRRQLRLLETHFSD